MQRLSPKGIQPSLVEFDVLATEGDYAVWKSLIELLEEVGFSADYVLVPLTGVDEDGEPCLIWDADDQLVMTEEPTP